MTSGLVDLDTLLREAAELEPLPQSTTRLATLVAEEEADLEEIAETIRLDEALTGRILGAANSSLSGSRTEITTVEAALMRMGSSQVLALAVGSSIGRSLARSLPAYGLEEGALWRHSVASALTVDRARRYCKRPAPPEAFAAALLHDVGKLILARHLEVPAREAIRRAREDRGLSLDDAEREVLGIGHGALGAQVARNWGLPESLALGVEHHHAPLAAPNAPARILCSYIMLADAVAAALAAPCDAEQRTTFSPPIAGILGLSLDGFEHMTQDVHRDLDEVMAVYEA